MLKNNRQRLQKGAAFVSGSGSRNLSDDEKAFESKDDSPRKFMQFSQDVNSKTFTSFSQLRKDGRNEYTEEDEHSTDSIFNSKQPPKQELSKEEVEKRRRQLNETRNRTYLLMLQK